MAIELTRTTEIKTENKIQLPQLVFKIKGYDRIFGIGQVKQYTKIGQPGLKIGDDWKIGGISPYPNQLDVIDIGQTSNTISQQLLQDKGGTSSVSSISISLIDKDGEITKLITPGEVLEDVLGVEAEVYLGYQETSWPQDFVRIFSGIISDISGGPTIILDVVHPEFKKKAEIFQKISTVLTSEANFKSKNIQHLIYKTRHDVVGTLTITYNGGGTAGAEVVSVAGNNISVQIQNGVSTNNQIRKAVGESLAAMTLLSDVIVEENFNNFATSTQATTSLLSDTTLNVESTKGLLLPVPSEGFRTYVRIDDEVIEYTGLTDTTITGCTREALRGKDQRARGDFHETGATVDSFYRLEGSAIEMALKVLMSGGPEYFAEDVPVKSLGYVEGLGPVANAVWFENLNIEDAYGVTIGDKVQLTLDQYAENDVTALISDVVSTPYGSYLILDVPTPGLTQNISSSASAAFASKWNVYPQGAGCAMGGHEVDVPEFERILAVFSSSIFTYDFYLKDTVTGSDFIDEEVLFPTGGFTLPRKGKVSCGYTSPPLGISGLKILNSSNTTKPDQNKIKRSLSRYFYNNIVYAYNEAVVDEKFLNGKLDFDQDSYNRIPTAGNKTLVIKCRGLRPSVDNDVVREILTKRFKEKFRFGAELISTYAFYGTTFDTDVGDVVIFGDSTLKIPDTKNGSRNFKPRLFEVSNKSLGIKSGEVKLDLLDSGYSLTNGRYGVISPSSLTVAAGSTVNQVKIKNSFGTVAPKLEKSKWKSLIGAKIIVHNDDWSQYAETYLKSFSPSDNFLINVEPALPFVVGDDFIIDIAPYPDSTDENEELIAKRIYVYTDPTVQIVSGTDNFSFDVDPADVDKFKVDAVLLVRDVDWNYFSEEVFVESIVGTTITVTADLGFTPVAGDEIDLIGFKDGGAPYRYL